MGGAANRLFTLLTTTTAAAAAAPIVLLRRRRISTITTTYSSLLFLRRRLRRSLQALSSPSPRRRLHSRSSSAAAGPLHHDGHSPPGRPWPEWSRLLDALSAAGYFDRRPDSSAGDEISPAASPEFSRSAAACLEFARERAGLVRLLSSRDVEVVVGNGTSLNSGETAGLDIGEVSTVDLMKFILSYVSNLVFPSENSYIHNRELVESSVRKLLHEMAKLCYVVPDSSSFGPMQGRYADGNGEPVRSAGPKIEMKRGDWICPRCSFMNFARNMKCLECEEARPKTQLTGGEWECPQCDFFNYGRNKVCLRCDCKRPGEVPITAPNTRLGTGYESGSNLNRADIDSRLAENEEKAQRWFSKISQLDSTSDPGTAIADDDFPEIMPLRKGVNRFVVSTRKTPLERRLANSQYQNDLGNVGSAADEPSFRPSSVSPQYGQSGGRNSTYVPFVPLPADMFANKPESSEGENRGKKVAGSSEVIASNTTQWANSGKSEAFRQKPSSQVESNADKEQVEKSDRWFQKVTELHRGIDHAGASPDGDFPETMLMRKGENRFILSKQKDRSLTSPAYKRQMAMEQASDTKFVPFVPFPPDYFSKKDDKPQTDVPGSTNKDASETTPNSAEKEKFPQTLDENKNLSQNFAGDRMGSNGISDKEVSNKTPNLPGSSGQPFDAQNVRESWAGKSLEGSAVKEPDPLDMSEEAKAERWFRRVAQIKDISELSQIPDEDFPSIMPMRKGVNRFVVSKRKSPLERRLTSPQYRRNLPTVNSDPLEKDSEST